MKSKNYNLSMSLFAGFAKADKPELDNNSVEVALGTGSGASEKPLVSSSTQIQIERLSFRQKFTTEFSICVR
ncbi:MAG: hypothetical protein K2Q26_06620 [Bdellovibrionales bacterium]|nr:hypothetical protein [Bdellovibrionales bacterium]